MPTPERRELLKPEALWEIDNGSGITVPDISRATAVRSARYRTTAEASASYDFLVLPTTQVFPFDAGVHWPDAIDGTLMDIYHRLLKTLVSTTLPGIAIARLPRRHPRPECALRTRTRREAWLLGLAG